MIRLTFFVIFFTCVLRTLATPECVSNKLLRYVRFGNGSNTDWTVVGFVGDIEEIHTEELTLRASLAQAYYLQHKIVVYADASHCKPLGTFNEFVIVRE